MIQQAFIDMENMFELLDVGQEVCHVNTKYLNMEFGFKIWNLPLKYGFCL